METELIINLASAIVKIISSVILFILAKQIISRENRSYYEKSFSIALILAGIASLMGAIFRVPYIISPKDPLEAWYYGSFIYYSIMAIALVFVLATGLAILKGHSWFNYSFISIIGVVPILFSYFGHLILDTDPFVRVSDPKEANIITTDTGFILLYGALAVLIFATVLVFFVMYLQTRLKAPLMMFFGMLTIAIAASIGGIGDIFAGELGRFLDPVSYAIILIGLILIYYGFRTKPRNDMK